MIWLLSNAIYAWWEQFARVFSLIHEFGCVRPKYSAQHYAAEALKGRHPLV